MLYVAGRSAAGLEAVAVIPTRIATLDEAFALLSGGTSALIAVTGAHPAGIVTRLDLLEYLAHHTTRA